MQVTKKIGADAGNDSLKLYLEEENYEGKKELEVMNVIAPGYKRRTLGTEKGHLSNLLDVTIQSEGKELGRYFVGGLAFKENREDLIEKSKKDKKAKSLDTIILIMTGCAYALYDPNNLEKTENVALGTLLPTEEYFYEDEDLVEIFEKNFKGKSYEVTFNSPAFNGAKITINIVDDEITPESAAGHLAVVYNAEGGFNEGMEKFKDETIIGIFIGSITTEISVFQNGEFLDKGFKGIPLGTSDPLDKILYDLGLLDIMSRHQLDFTIRNNKKLIANINGKTEDMTEKLKISKERRFNEFVKTLVNRINNRLAPSGINIELANRINMGGGGSITCFDSFKKEFNAGNTELVKNARFANALGALYSIVSKQNDKEAAADEVLG
ncbi:ParM/StbA family protein [Clostridium sp. 19966]|uniref:ParM/StbA family protein n=1 Tax=Clostridium sp. 19966 TaxID=2768166 RepID=UPI0028DF16B1|nr:ParM/StbA family protein [Clostridium sp. 19966]MDT8718241.1 ParM/StbA family protein [Clostridium sp. 19966]